MLSHCQCSLLLLYSIFNQNKEESCMKTVASLLQLHQPMSFSYIFGRTIANVNLVVIWVYIEQKAVGWKMKMGVKRFYSFSEEIKRFRRKQRIPVVTRLPLSILSIQGILVVLAKGLCFGYDIPQQDIQHTVFYVVCCYLLHTKYRWHQIHVINILAKILSNTHSLTHIRYFNRQLMCIQVFATNHVHIQPFYITSCLWP